MLHLQHGKQHLIFWEGDFGTLFAVKYERQYPLRGLERKQTRRSPSDALPATGSSHTPFLWVLARWQSCERARSFLQSTNASGSPRCALGLCRKQ